MSSEFDTRGAKEVFIGNRNFGKDYTVVESLAESESSVSFLSLPTDKVTMNVRLAEGEYLLIAAYEHTMSGTNRNFASDVTVDGGVERGVVEETIGPDEYIDLTRMFPLTLLRGDHEFKLRFGPIDMPATAKIRNASLILWRAR